MDWLHILPFFSTAITLAFALAVLNRFWHGRKPHTLMWGIGLLFYAAGTFAEAWLAVQWNAPLLRVWYAAGAMLTAAWMGQGTIYLLVRKPGLADRFLQGLLLISAVAIGLVWATPVTAAGFDPRVPLSTQYKDLLLREGFTVFLTVLLNIYGTITLIGGAAWSAWLFARKQVLPNRMWGNVLIAVGALFPASAGTLIRLGLGDWLYLSELLGATLMFVGFWLATQSADTPVLMKLALTPPLYQQLQQHAQQAQISPEALAAQLLAEGLKHHPLTKT